MSDAYTATARVADALAAAAIPFAIGGSIAMAVSGYARATVDGDINVFVPMGAARPALEALAAAGLDVDVEGGVRMAAERGDGRLHVDGIRVDLFFDSIPLHHDAARRLATVWVGERAYPALSPEDLTVLKAMFNRAKDWVDIERIVAAMGPAFDGAYAQAQLAAHLGAEDASIERLGRIVRDWQPGGDGARRFES